MVNRDRINITCGFPWSLSLYNLPCYGGVVSLTVIDEKKILEFIQYFNESKNTFLNGCCYWFAFILKERFNATIYYDSILDHFISKIGEEFYDVRGNVTEQLSYLKNHKDALIKFDDLKDIDPALYIKVVNGCINKTYD